MASTTPTNPPPPLGSSGTARDRSRSASRTRVPSRPTTPLRPSSRSSLRNSQTALSLSTSQHPYLHNASPLDALESQFAEFADGMADLEANFMHLQLMHESLARFGESFASFLYGMNINAFCVDFTEGPVKESFVRAERGAFDGGVVHGMGGSGVVTGLGGGMHGDVDATFLTTDTSFVENPPTSSKVSSKYSTPAPASRAGRGGARGRGLPRASGIARGSTRGRARGGSAR